MSVIYLFTPTALSVMCSLKLGLHICNRRSSYFVNSERKTHEFLSFRSKTWPNLRIERFETNHTMFASNKAKNSQRTKNLITRREPTLVYCLANSLPVARTQNRNHKVINKVIHSQEIDREKYRDNCNRKMTSFSLEANTTDLTNHSPLVTRFI